MIKHCQWWRKRDEGNGVDEWVRNRLGVEVPGDSFARVWAGATRSKEAESVRRQPPWELALTVHRLRLRTRALTAVLTVVVTVLGMVLVNFRGVGREEMWEGSEKPAVAGSKEKMDGELVRRSQLVGLSEKDACRLYSLLRDQRIIYNTGFVKDGGV